jgi:glycosyltransferase involved in cell wall biosynthesis
MLLSLFLRKKTLVVVGGFDAAYVPEIGYGIFVNRWRRVLTNIVYRQTDKILVVDISLKKDVVRNSHLDTGKKIVVIPTGYDSAKWKLGDRDRENLVITVAGVKWSNVRRKGLETFVKTAKYLPDMKFVLIGKHYDDSIQYLKSISTSNVYFTGFISENELIRYYQRAKVYCQLSRYEGLPTSLCEAMLCGCIPVGTKYCGIPTAIGNAGFYVPYGDIKSTVAEVQRALNAKDEKRNVARERIKKNFPLQRRERELVNNINELLER